MTDEQLLELRGVGIQSIRLIRSAVGYSRPLENQEQEEAPSTASLPISQDHTSVTE
ncbi:hypothetical protein [Rhizobium sp. RCC_161_2]|uniref:hypothetical protein n=1 Tax=Rhizobium sp. RCC_161_2 TaxID=3239219 RepID=UPI003523811B